MNTCILIILPVARRLREPRRTVGDFSYTIDGNIWAENRLKKNPLRSAQQRERNERILKAADIARSSISVQVKRKIYRGFYRDAKHLLPPRNKGSKKVDAYPSIQMIINCSHSWTYKHASVNAQQRSDASTVIVALCWPEEKLVRQCWKICLHSASPSVFC